MTTINDAITTFVVNGAFARHLPKDIAPDEELFVRTMVTAKLTQATLAAEESSAQSGFNVITNKLAELMGQPFGHVRRNELLQLALDVAQSIAEAT